MRKIIKMEKRIRMLNKEKRVFAVCFGILSMLYIFIFLYSKQVMYLFLAICFVLASIISLLKIKIKKIELIWIVFWITLLIIVSGIIWTLFG